MHTPQNNLQFAVPDALPGRHAQLRLHTPPEPVPANASGSEVLAPLRERTQRALRYLFNFMNANAEQFLLGLAMKAASRVEKAEFHAAIREWQVKRQLVEERFTTAVLAEFDQPAPGHMDTASAPAGAIDTLELTLQPKELELVQDDRLAESAAVKTLVTRALAEHRDMLLDMARYVMNRTGQRGLDAATLPVAPAVLARHFFTAVSTAGVPPETGVVFVKLFARFVIDELELFYTQCTSGLPLEAEAAESVKVEVSAADILELQDLPTAPRPVDAEVSAIQNTPEVLWDLTRTPLLAAPGKAMALPRGVLDQVLQGLQRAPLEGGKLQATLNPKAGIPPLEVYELLNEALMQLGHQKPVALTPDVIEAVNLLRLLFDRMLRDERIVAPVRRVLRLLQIPLLRAALHDPEVLSSAAHPVRVFFSELVESVTGWKPHGELASDELFRALQHAVVRIVSGYGTDASVFTAALGDLRAAMRSRQARIRLLEQHAMLAEVGRTSREAARATVTQEITRILGDATVPRVAVDFLRGPWSDALFVVFLRHGVAGAEWKEALGTTASLVTAAAKRSGVDYTAIAPDVLRTLRVLGLAEEDAEADLRGLVESLDSVMPAATAAHSRSLDEPAAEFLQMVDKLAPDTWIEFRLPGHTTWRAQLQIKFPKTGEFVFVNGEGGRAGSWQRVDLAAAFQSGEAVVISGPRNLGTSHQR